MSRGSSSIRTTRGATGFTGTVAVHLCFGYAALVHGKPSGYSMAARKLRLRRPGAAGLRNHPGSSAMFAAIRPFRPLCDDARSLADRQARLSREVVECAVGPLKTVASIEHAGEVEAVFGPSFFVEVASIRIERIVFSSRKIFSKLASTSKAGWPCCTRICYWVCA